VCNFIFFKQHVIKICFYKIKSSNEYLNSKHIFQSKILRGYLVSKRVRILSYQIFLPRSYQPRYVVFSLKAWGRSDIYGVYYYGYLCLLATVLSIFFCSTERNYIKGCIPLALSLVRSTRFAQKHVRAKSFQ